MRKFELERGKGFKFFGIEDDMIPGKSFKFQEEQQLT
jgi:hypothetical protein